MNQATALRATPKRRVLITGAAGRIGQVLARAWADVYDLVLVDVVRPALASPAAFIQASAADPDMLRCLCRGVDTLVPLAISGNINEDWDAIAPVNLTGIWAAFQAAAEAGCRRVIYPSSVQIDLKPKTPYGASKLWGEGLGQKYAGLTDLSVICLRLGAVVAPHDRRIFPGSPILDHALTHRDLVSLFAASLEAPDELNYGIFWGISANQPARFELSPARSALGYQPQDDAFQLAKLAARNPRVWLRSARYVWRQTRKRWLNL